jgi:hypothetical protein
MIAGVDPGYRDVRERAENARKQQLIARLTAEARQLHQAGQWAAVVKVGQRLRGLDRGAANPDGLVTSAQAELTAAQATERLAADYESAVRLLDAGNWRQAIEALERVAQVNPAYRATPALMDQARRQLATTKASPRPQSSGPRRSERRQQPPKARPAPFVPPPRILQVGRIDAINAVAFSPDGTRLATGSTWRITMWDLRTGDILWQHRIGAGIAKTVLAVAFSPDGTRLATGSNDRTARIWDTTTGQQQLEFYPGGVVLAVAFSPDGTRLATGSKKKTARIWDASTGGELIWVNPATGQQEREISHKGAVWTVAFSRDGNRLATGSDDKTARIWDMATRRQQFQVTHAGAVLAVAFNRDGTRLATGSDDKTARVWYTTTGNQQFQVTHARAVQAVAFSPDGTRLATGSMDTIARISDITGG